MEIVVLNAEATKMSNEIDDEEVGGNWACVLGCIGSCLVLGATASAVGSVVTMM